MNIKDWSKWVLGPLVELLWPKPCAGCGALCAELLCAQCLALCLSHGGPRCTRCDDCSLTPVCARCRGRGYGVSRARGVWHYSGPMQRALQAGKHGGAEALFVQLARTVAQDPQAHALGRACDLIVPIPLAASRRWQRGYNPSAIVARTLAQAWHRPIAHLLRRAGGRRPPQSTLDEAARQRGMAQAFLSIHAGRTLAGRTPLLVDDVSTTGATLHAAARALKAQGAKRVLAVVVAKQTLESPWQPSL